MGRAVTRQEEYALSRACRALQAFAGLAALGLLLVWLVGPMVYGEFDNRRYAAVAVVVMTAYLLMAVGVGRGWTPVWALALLMHGGSVLGTTYRVLTTPRVAYFVALAFEGWVVSRLLDPDAVRVFLRFRDAAPPVRPVPGAPVQAPIVRQPAPGATRSQASYDFFG